jgi:hypothetical protein
MGFFSAEEFIPQSGKHRGISSVSSLSSWVQKWANQRAIRFRVKHRESENELGNLFNNLIHRASRGELVSA